METLKKFELDKSIILLPGETVAGPDDLTITLEGYGHKFGKGPEQNFSFIEMNVKQTDESEGFRITLPLKSQTTHLWKNWKFIFLKCDDQGPPHSSLSSTELIVSHLPR